MNTVQVRPVGEVMEELHGLLIRRLPGSQAVSGAWGTLLECRELIRFGEAMLAEEDLTHGRAMITHGEIMAATRIVRKLADAFRVSNIRQ